MLTELRNSITQVIARLQTKRILNTYAKSNPIEKEKLRFAEIKRIGENKYNIHAYLRLAIMSSTKWNDCVQSLRAIVPSEQRLNTMMSYMTTTYPNVHRFA